MLIGTISKCRAIVLMNCIK